MLQIAVAAEEFLLSQVFLAAMVHDTVNGIVKVGNKNVNVHISEEGSEVAYDSDSIVISLMSSKRADSYSLLNALKKPSGVPKGELGLSVRTSDTFFGRAHFIGVGAEETKKLCNADGVILIAEEPFSDKMKSLAESCVLKGIPVTAAIMCRSGSDPVDSNPDKALEEMDEDMKLYPFVKYAGWYDPCGFEQGKRLSPEDAAPIGIQPLFWSVLRTAAEKKTGEITEEMRYYEKVIKSRASVFQKKSLRRVKELEKARAAYSEYGSEIITAENMLGLANEYFNKGGTENAT